MYDDQEEYVAKAKFDFKVWKRIFKQLFKYKKSFFIAILAMITLTFLDTEFMHYICTDGMSDFLNSNMNVKDFIIFIIKMLLLVSVSSFCTFLFIHFASVLELKFFSTLTKETFEKIQNQPFSFFDHSSVGYLMARVSSDTSKLGEIVSWGMVDIVYAIFKLIFVVIIMARIEIKLALIMLIIIPLICIISILFRKIIIKLSRKQRKINSEISSKLNEGISGAKTSKTLVLEEKNSKEFGEVLNKYKKITVKISWAQSSFYQIVAYSSALALALIGYFGGLFASSNNPAFTASTLFLFLSYSTSFFDPVLTIARLSNEMKHAQVAAERVFNLNDLKPEIMDREDIIEKYGDYKNLKKENWEPLKGKIEFDNVSFAYKKGEEVLKKFNLKVNQGQSVALVGETGAGKSTIINLLCRFYEPTSGKILIDGKDYKERSVSWLHSNLGYVLQSPQLFSGTIMENIRYGRLDASDEEVKEAARIVHAEEFILKMEKGYDSDVGEGGNKLSLGQKQLISFARAIIANPKIIILDEATSSIDTETEFYIQQAIKSVLKGRTSFVVAHRLSTIVNSDIILVISNGQIMEKGTHEELMSLKGMYYQLYTNQFIEDKMKELNF